MDPQNWRDLMEITREIGRKLRDEGKIDICQKGQVVTGTEWTGPIRFRIKET